MPQKKHLISLVCFVVFIWAGSFLILLATPDWSKRGQIGDMFGAVNSLFSGLAFAGLFYTIMLQRTEFSVQQQQLSLQRDELKLQREEMVESRKELANQAAAQNSLFLATVAQVKVAAIQADIEALKVMDGQGFQKGPYAEDIRAEARKIASIADDLKNPNLE